MVFMLSSFMFLLLILMMIFPLMWLLVLIFMFQRMMMMAEDRLKIKSTVQPRYKGFIEIDYIDCQSNYVKRILHFQLDPELIENEDAKVRKK